MRRIIPVLILVLLFPAAILAAPKTITLLHTNDLHSHLMPFAPELDFVPGRTGVDDTVGGWARIATVLQNERAARTNPVFTVDSGDFTMGTLFHMLAREHSFELRLMHDMGYDYITLGNHEFDMFPHGLARIITTAHENHRLPAIVFASAVFSHDSDRDDSLKEVFDKGLVRPYAVTETDGVRLGFYGIMGKVAAGDAPFASPVTFSDPVETSRSMVKVLREKEKVDIVICLSHSGLYVGSSSEDEELARQVDGIDVIVSGHSHTILEEPLMINDTIILQAGNYGRAVGVLDFTLEKGKALIKNYKLVRVDDQISVHPGIQSQIDDYIALIDEEVLKDHGLSYWEIIGSTDFDMPIREEESTAGNLLADAIRWYVEKRHHGLESPEETPVRMAIKANGVIRAGILKGKTGKLAVCDIFRMLPLGIGMDQDNTPGYPLVTCYIHGYEIKRALEVVTSVYPLKGSAYFLQVSGVKFTYNPYRMLFDRVTGIWIQNENREYEPLDYSRSNKELYRVAANIYEATFLQVIGDFTYNILNIVPKDRHGNPIDSLVDFRVDARPDREGIQELKEWVAVMEYISHLDDVTGDGLADIPEKYRHPEGRIVKKHSINPLNLLHRGTMITWAAFAVIVLLAAAFIFILRVVVRRIGYLLLKG